MNEQERQTCREALITARHVCMTSISAVPNNESEIDRLQGEINRIDAALAVLDTPQPPAQPTMPDDIKDDIGLCAAGIVLAYYRKTHDHILRDDDALNAALRVEKWLGRR